MTTMSNAQHQIYITVDDHQRLSRLLNDELKQIHGCKSHLNNLQTELGRAIVVEAGDVPGDVVTMDSIVEFSDIDTKEREILTLVYPEADDGKEHLLSIFAPIGTAILGYRVGDIITWNVPVGSRRVQLENLLFQPERDEG